MLENIAGVTGMIQGKDKEMVETVIIMSIIEDQDLEVENETMTDITTIDTAVIEIVDLFPIFIVYFKI